MAQQQITITDGTNTLTFDNGTRMDVSAFTGQARQWRAEAGRLRVFRLPAEEDTSPEFRRAMQTIGIREQETLYLDVAGPSRLRGFRASPAENDRIILRPAASVTAQPEVKVVLYQDEAGGISWHFPDGFFEAKVSAGPVARSSGLRAPAVPVFTIPTRTVGAQKALQGELPPARLRGTITKIGRKIFKVLVVPLSRLIADPLEEIIGKVERKYRPELIRRLTPDNYRKAITEEFTDWAALQGKRTLLVVHGIFSSCEGMLNGLPPVAMQAFHDHYDGRVLGYNHLTASRTPEQNATEFLMRLKQQADGKRFEFDVLCHSRGGIVTRTMVERGLTLVPDHPCDFRRVFFVATPNQGSPLADAEHMLDMLDVFTNLLTHLPDGPTLYSVEVFLALIKLLAYTAEKNVPGLSTMGTKGYIEDVLNSRSVPSPAAYPDDAYAAAASNYVPGPDSSLLGVNGYAATYVLDRIFMHGSNRILNDLVVPREGVYASNGHPSFPIPNPLVFDTDDHVWHTSFFEQSRTLEHIAQHFGIPLPASLSMQPTSSANRPRLRDTIARPLESGFGDAESTEEASVLSGDAGGSARGIDASESLMGGTSGTHEHVGAPRTRRSGLRQPVRPDGKTPPTASSGNRPPEQSGAASAATTPTELTRNPAIDFHEIVREGEANKLVVRLEDIADQDPLAFDDAFNIVLPGGQQSIDVIVRITAPGFDVRPSKRKMTVNRLYDRLSEQVSFTLTARHIAPQPVLREIRADFLLANDCIGSVTHSTTVVPKDHPDWMLPGSGVSQANPFALPQRPRERWDLKITVAGQDDSGKPPFKMWLTNQIPGLEYDDKYAGIFTAPQDDLSGYLDAFYTQQFATNPDLMNEDLTEAKYMKRRQEWEADFSFALDNLGRTLWTFLPEKFRQEYFRLYRADRPPRSILINSDEMIFPWELVIPHDIANGIDPLRPLGAAHILGRWKPGLGMKPTPQRVRVQRFCVLSPIYDDVNSLSGAQEELENLKQEFPGLCVITPADLPTVQTQVLNSENIQLLHFSGHGDYDPNNADLNRLMLQGNKSLDAMAVVGTRLAAKSCPIVFLNACHVGRTGTAVGRSGGFAAKMLENGCSGVVAPYWAVYDDSAAGLALALYRKLQMNYSIGEALQQLRSEHPNDPTYRAFAFFGDPWASVYFALPRTQLKET